MMKSNSDQKNLRRQVQVRDVCAYRFYASFPILYLMSLDIYGCGDRQEKGAELLNSCNGKDPTKMYACTFETCKT